VRSFNLSKQGFAFASAHLLTELRQQFRQVLPGAAVDQ